MSELTKDPSGGEGEDNSNNGTASDNESSSPAQMSLTSDEVNYLVFRYLQESGFVHSAFSFVHESLLGRTGLRAADKTVPPGALVTFLQKGLQYVGIEESLNQQPPNNGEDNSAVDFSILSNAAIRAITRQNPPIQLNVPPAAAAAAVKARLEAQAKLDEERRSQQLVAAASSASLTDAVVAQQQVSPVLEDPNATFARQALAAQAAAAAMSQLTHIGQPVVADALIQQQRVAAAADIMALQQQQQRLVAGQQAMDAATASTIVHQQQQQQGKRATPGGKRSAKKQKLNKRTEDTSKSAGFSSLEEAVAQLEASKKAKATDGTVPMDIDTNDQNPVGGGLPAHQGSTDEISKQMNGEPPRNGKASDAIHGSENGSKVDERRLARKNLPPVDDSDTASPTEEVLKLELHQSEVFMCAWNPVFTNLIATGSGDASARIWEMGGQFAASGLTDSKLLPHGSDTRDQKNKDVTTLEWSSTGELLATGSYDGVARIWSRTGALLHTLRGHHGPIFSLKWNKRGDYLLSGSYDHTTIVWDVSESTGFIQQQFTVHKAPALDVDWKDNETFASCSTDKTVQVCRVGADSPLKIFVGHKDEVNGVKWDPTGKYLASCSDDCTAKVWEVDSDRSGPLYDFNLHKEEIYTLKWSPSTSKKPLLATASFDGTVMLWNIEDGSRYSVFDRHRDSVYSVAFSPSGDFLASGSLAGQMYIWDIEKGVQIKSYKGDGDIFEVAWNKEETRVAGCFSSSMVAVIDFDKTKL